MVYCFLHDVERCEEIAAVDFLDRRPGKPLTSREIDPPAVFTSTGTEIA
jgi:hypothetical protein